MTAPRFQEIGMMLADPVEDFGQNATKQASGCQLMVAASCPTTWPSGEIQSGRVRQANLGGGIDCRVDRSGMPQLRSATWGNTGTRNKRESNTREVTCSRLSCL
jgi:hypothetical protein